MMDFEEFKASVADQIKDYLPEKYADARGQQYRSEYLS